MFGGSSLCWCSMLWALWPWGAFFAHRKNTPTHEITTNPETTCRTNDLGKPTDYNSHPHLWGNPVGFCKGWIPSLGPKDLGGWTNPFRKIKICASQIGSWNPKDPGSFPQVIRGENSKHIWVATIQLSFVNASIQRPTLHEKKHSQGSTTAKELSKSSTLWKTNIGRWSSWWFQPLWKILVKMGIFHR